MENFFPISLTANVFQTCFVHIHFDVISKKHVVKKLAISSPRKKVSKTPLCASLRPTQAGGGAP
jgi:hypothetical protein